MNVYDLKDRVAIVTGGAQGIGLAVATRILASGGKVAIWDRDTALLERFTNRSALNVRQFSRQGRETRRTEIELNMSQTPFNDCVQHLPE